MKLISVLLTTIGVLLISCGSANSDQSTADTLAQPTAIVSKPVYDQSLIRGEIIDSIPCKYSIDQSYALYLPSYYSTDKKFPCIYFFDAHARGLLPLKLYKDIAEKYGFVLIASNNSKNGMQWQETNALVKTLMNDSRNRINIDSQRIYTGGFSGGARVASTIAIANGGIAGVIGCAAGFPKLQQAFQNKFDYFGMVGIFDFNLIEMEQLDQDLQQNGFAHQLFTFDGKHDWPSSSNMRTAILWLQVNAIKENFQSKNDAIITDFKQDYSKLITAAKSSGDLIREYCLLDGMTRTLSGITDISSCKKQSEDLMNSNSYKNAVALQSKLQHEELTQQQVLQQQFTQQNEAWWTKKVTSLKQNIHSAKIKQEAQMNQRLLNFIGLIGYLNASHALNTADLTNAIASLKIFKMADPKNSDCSYLTATYYSKKGDQQQALKSLNESALLGFSDVTMIETDPAFEDLQENAVFKNVVSEIRKNRSAN